MHMTDSQQFRFSVDPDGQLTIVPPGTSGPDDKSWPEQYGRLDRLYQQLRGLGIFVGSSLWDFVRAMLSDRCQASSPFCYCGASKPDEAPECERCDLQARYETLETASHQRRWHGADGRKMQLLFALHPLGFAEG
jgi:hypothetical protein